MNDFLTEVEEDLKREKYEKLWAKYSNHLFAVMLSVVAGVAGYQYWQKNETAKRQFSGNQFDLALLASKEGKKEASDILATVIVDGGKHKNLARVLNAAELAKTDLEGAKAALDALALDPSLDQNTRDIAAIRVAFLLSETAPLAEINKRVERLATNENPYRFTARELIGLSAFKNGNPEVARQQFTLIQSDSEATEQIRSRAQLMLTVLGK